LLHHRVRHFLRTRLCFQVRRDAARAVPQVAGARLQPFARLPRRSARFVRGEPASPLSALRIQYVHESRPETEAAQEHRAGSNRRIRFPLKELHFRTSTREFRTEWRQQEAGQRKKCGGEGEIAAAPGNSSQARAWILMVES